MPTSIQPRTPRALNERHNTNPVARQHAGQVEAKYMRRPNLADAMWDYTHNGHMLCGSYMPVAIRRTYW